MSTFSTTMITTNGIHEASSMNMHEPPHPGILIRIQLIEDEDGNKLQSVAEAADKLGCHRNTLNRLLNGTASLSAEMALALENSGCGSAEFWLGLQNAYDLYRLRHHQVA